MRDLHAGQMHDAALTDAEQAAYESAVDAEADALFVHHLKSVGALVALYAALVVGYMIVLSGGI